ncbi:MAG: hypothetical protein MJ184_03590 [Treponema sp.]|uniref:hypothetical protein n=1 Tax=Treponema sp. TaxID=166 RepID=UPI00298DC76A|nr:hypothetical protein [Treponema sp.]MCQ2600421.1 hypothetical protein [Treponema sp.]
MFKKIYFWTLLVILAVIITPYPITLVPTCMSLAALSEVSGHPFYEIVLFFLLWGSMLIYPFLFGAMYIFGKILVHKDRWIGYVLAFLPVPLTAAFLCWVFAGKIF